MPEKPGLFTYIKAAFSARPKGMLVAPNWIGVAVFALFGLFVNPGFLVVGAGAELAYLLFLGTNNRFQRLVDALRLYRKQEKWEVSLVSQMNRLGINSRDRFARLQDRCKSVLDLYSGYQGIGSDILEQHSKSLTRFLWIFLQLLTTKEAIQKVMKERASASSSRESLEESAQAVERRLENKALTDEVRRSLESQRDILQQRLQAQNELVNKLQYVDAELDRIEQQVELIREQAVVSRDSQVISTRIDTVTESLGDTSKWIKEQQTLFGSIQDLTEEPPPILIQRTATPGKE